MSLFRAYRRLLSERPFITNVLTSATFMTTGDLTSQLIVQRREQINFSQTAIFGITGLVFVGPAVRTCLVMIDKIFGPTSSVLVLAKKLTFDQLLCAPTFLAGNITMLTLLKTGSFERVKEELDRSYTTLLKLNYKFWPFVQVLNFYFIPLKYRVLFGSTAALIWSSVFSFKLYGKKQHIGDTTSKQE